VLRHLRPPLSATAIVLVVFFVAPLFSAEITSLQRVDAGLAASAKASHDITNLRNAIADRLQTLDGKDKNAGAADGGTDAKESADALHDLDKKAAGILNGTTSSAGVAPIHRRLARVRTAIQSGDATSADAAKAILDRSCSALNQTLAAWHDLDAHAVPATTNIIAKSSLAALPTSTVMSIMAVPNSDAPNDACAP